MLIKPTGTCGVLTAPGITIDNTVNVDVDLWLASIQGTAGDRRFGADGRNFFTPGVEIFFGSYDQNIEIRDTVRELPDVTAQNDIDIDNDRYGLRLFGRLTRVIHDRVNLFGELGVIVQYIDAELDSRYRFTCPVCSAALSQVVLQTSDDANDWSFGGEIGGGVEISITDAFSVAATVHYRDGTNTATADIPQTGDAVLAGDRIKLDFESTSSVIGRVAAVVKF